MGCETVSTLLPIPVTSGNVSIFLYSENTSNNTYNTTNVYNTFSRVQQRRVSCKTIYGANL